MAAAPVYAATPTIDTVQIATANTNRDGTGTLGTVATGTTNGKLINRVVIEGVGTVTAGMIRLYIDNGTNVRLWKEIAVTATTPSASVAGWTTEFSFVDLVLPNTYILKASTHNAETFNVIAFGAAI